MATTKSTAPSGRSGNQKLGIRVEDFWVQGQL